MLSGKKAKSTQSAKKRNKGNNSKGTYISGKDSFFEFSETPASYEVSLSNPTKFRIKGEGLRHSEYGSSLRCEGRQQYILVTTTASDNSLFANGIGSVTNANFCFISPSLLNDRIAAFASLYQRYAFRKLRFVYVTRVGTTQVGSFAISYLNDSGMAGATGAPSAFTYGTIQSIEPTKIVPFRKEIDCLDVSYSGDRTWYTVFDTNADANTETERQCFQGAFIGYPDKTSIGVVNMGEIYLDYVVDFYTPSVVDSNITLARSLPRNCKVLETLVSLCLKHRGKPEDLKSFLIKVSEFLELFK